MPLRNPSDHSKTGWLPSEELEVEDWFQVEIWTTPSGRYGYRFWSGRGESEEWGGPAIWTIPKCNYRDSWENRAMRVGKLLDKRGYDLQDMSEEFLDNLRDE